MTAGLCLVPATEFGLSSRWPNLPRGGAWFDIDKAWHEFDQVFRDMPPPLDRAIEGDIPPEERSPEEIDATSLSFVSPEAVVAIARALEQIEPEEMIGLIAEQVSRVLDDWDRKYFADYYEKLRQAYRAAAAVGAGLAMLLC
jgi:hypothetical protein